MQCVVNVGVTLSDDALFKHHKNDTSTQASTAETGTTTVASTSEVTTGMTTAPPPAPPDDVWTVSYQKTSMYCILLSANITVTYNDTDKVYYIYVYCFFFFSSLWLSAWT